MPADLRWSSQAREDLLDIYVTIGLDNPDAAERLFTTIEDESGLLRVHPRLGVRCPEIAPSARKLMEGAYLVLYETHPNTDDGPVKSVEVVRVVDGSRNLRLL